MLKKIQQIIRTGNQEDAGRSNIQTFLFLWGYGENLIRKTQDELAAASGIDTRTLRSHLYALNKDGWIDYSGNPGGKPDGTNKNIRIKRFKH